MAKGGGWVCNLGAIQGRCWAHLLDNDVTAQPVRKGGRIVGCIGDIDRASIEHVCGLYRGYIGAV